MSLKLYVRHWLCLGFLLFAATSPLLPEPSTDRSQITAQSIMSEIDAQGAASVVKSLNVDHGSKWHAVMQNVETGSTQWLDVATKLLQGTDAGYTEDIYFALSLALTRNAEGVLSRVGPDLSIRNVCSVPYIEPTEKMITTYRQRAHNALNKVTSAELAQKKAECLRAVDYKPPEK